MWDALRVTGRLLIECLDDILEGRVLASKGLAGAPPEWRVVTALERLTVTLLSRYGLDPT